MSGKRRKVAYLPQKQKRRSDDFVLFAVNDGKKMWLGLKKGKNEKGVISVRFDCSDTGVNSIIEIEGVELHHNVSDALTLKGEHMAILMRGLCWMISTLRTGNPNIDRRNAALENIDYERLIVDVVGTFQ